MIKKGANLAGSSFPCPGLIVVSLMERVSLSIPACGMSQTEVCNTEHLSLGAILAPIFCNALEDKPSFFQLLVPHQLTPSPSGVLPGSAQLHNFAVASV